KRRSIAGVNSGWNLLGLFLIEDLHDGKIIVDPSLRIGDLEDFAVTAGLLIGALDRRSFRALAVTEGPMVARDLAGRAPGTRAVQGDLLARRDQVVGPGQGNELRPVLPLIGLPEERIRALNSPLAGGLFCLDVEMEVRPAAATALFP